MKRLVSIEEHQKRIDLFLERQKTWSEAMKKAYRGWYLFILEQENKLAQETLVMLEKNDPKKLEDEITVEDAICYLKLMPFSLEQNGFFHYIYHEFSVHDLFDLTKMPGGYLWQELDGPAWQILAVFKEAFDVIVANLDKRKYEEIDEGVFIGSGVKIDKSAVIQKRAIISSGSEIRPCAFLRGNVILGENTVIGNSCEIKSSLISAEATIPHYNYIGDSIIGHKAHFGAGSLTSNIKLDKKYLNFKVCKHAKVSVGLRKFGALVGDSSEIGCNSVLNPATILAKDVLIYPLSSVRSYVKKGTRIKS